MMFEQINQSSIAAHGAPSEIWDRAIAEYHDAKASWEAYCAEVYMPAYQREIAYTGHRPENKFTMVFDGGEPVEFTLPPDNRQLYDRDPVLGRAAAKCRREIECYERRHAQIRRTAQFDEIYKHHDDLFDRMCLLEDQLMTLAAPDFAALAVKCVVGLAGDRAIEPNPSWTAGIRADAARLGNLPLEM